MSRIVNQTLGTKISVEHAGLPPGTLVAESDRQNEIVNIRLFEYDDHEFSEKEIHSVKECLEALKRPTIKWIDVDGIHNAKIIEEIGKQFHIHPLTLEDVMTADQRPKFEEYANYLVLILKMIYYDTHVSSEQLSIVILDNVVVTFQEDNGQDVFDTIRERIRTNKGRVRKAGADYLAYALLDAVVDSYFLILEKVGDKIGTIEEQIMTEPGQELLKEIHNLKREMIFLRKSVWPTRELINSLHRTEHALFSAGTSVYVRDVYDHTIRIIETVEAYRDLLSGMMDIYLSTNSIRMNEVMKLLTIISSIFIPVTFLVGVYGMNFEYMPELRTKWAYPALWVIMISISIGMLLYFRRKKWL